MFRAPFLFLLHLFQQWANKVWYPNQATAR